MGNLKKYQRKNVIITNTREPPVIFSFIFTFNKKLSGVQKPQKTGQNLKAI
jgi:hypothetical protein